MLDRSLAAMAADLRHSGRAVIVTGGTDALEQVVRQIPTKARYAAIHVVSHGDEGEIIFDGVPVSAEALSRRHAPALAALRRHLAPGGDILVYGCKSARGPAGRALLQALAEGTGADVAGSASPTGTGRWALEQRLGAVRTEPLSLPVPTRLWTSELYEGGWFGDTNVPTGATAPHPKAGQTGSGRLSTMGDNTGGPGVSFSVQSLSCCTAQTIGNVFSGSYATAVTNNDYFYSNIVVGGSNGATITKFQYNQVSNNSSGAQFQLALYDTTTTTLTPLTSAFTVSGSTTSIQITTSTVAMVAGRTYQLRFYGFNCGILGNCYIDNPQIWTKANEAPTASNDSYTTPYVTAVSGNLASNDSDPESQTLSISAINGSSYTTGTPIALSGGSLTITNAAGNFTFTPASGFYGTQTFTYTISDGYGGTATATASIAVNQADLSLSMSVGSASVFQGASQTYTLTVRSSASSTVTATGITVRDVLPAGFTYASATGTGTFNSGTGDWSVGSLAPGGSASLTITGTATAAKGATVNNTAQITASSVVDPDSTPNNGATGEDDYASASFTVIDPSLSVTKTSQVTADPVNASNPKAIPGATVRYCVVVTNTGNTTATSITATDTLPAQTSYVSGSGRTGTSCGSASSTSGLSVTGSTVTATSSTLSPAQSFAFTFDVTIS